MHVLIQIFTFLGFIVVVDCLKIQFNTLSTVYLPYTYSPTPQYKLDYDAAEQLSFDAQANIIYSVGHTNIHVIDISNVTNPQVLYHTSYDDVDATDVEVCGDHVFVAFDNQAVREAGFIDVFKVYNKASGSLEHVQRIVVGDIPDMIHPIKDCSKVIVAIEAEPYIDTVHDTLIDNAGGVGVITFDGSPSGTYTYKVVDFEKFNERFSELEKTGVRWIYRENNNSFSNDVEPEYITLNDDESKAYISLQENNAIAVFDMKTEEIEAIYGLGFKNWSESLLDSSDKDGGINIWPWPVYGMFQPDSIKFYTHHGVDYIITANEGDSKDYDDKFTEEVTVANIQLSEMFESNATIRQAIQQDEQLGRLKITTENGKNQSGKFDKLYTFGGRSFSIRTADTMELIYDSGGDISLKTALLHSNIFNSDYEEGKSALSSMDTRSDNKGPETESITIGHFGDVTLLMIGNERPGTIAVYSIDERLSSVTPTFQTLLTGIHRTNDTWDNLYDTREISMLDPEDIRFIPSDESPNGKPLLLVSGSTSGTVSVIEVEVKQDFENDDNYSTGNIAPTVYISKVLLLVYAVLYLLW